ncbi:MAG TPA: hypothetical protein PLH72_01190 [Vicinamibacterales bacterium]|nr:hypothetical protein [Vicinamibacterales bacterium]
MRKLLGALVAVAMLGAAPAGQASQTFTGIVSDEMCGLSHAAMRMGPTDAECTVACHEEHDAAYVLVVGEHIYALALADEAAPKALAGKTVKVVGTLDAGTNTIRVESMTSG